MPVKYDQPTNTHREKDRKGERSAHCTRKTNCKVCFSKRDQEYFQRIYLYNTYAYHDSGEELREKQFSARLDVICSECHVQQTAEPRPVDVLEGPVRRVVDDERCSAAVWTGL